MKSHVLLAAAFCLATPALAGGPVETPVEPVPAAAPAPATGMDWTGFYVGLSAFQGDYSDDGGATDAGETDGFGLQAGYLRDFGRFVVGGELAHVRGSYEVADWNASRLKLIGGYDAGRFLPYGFVGLSKYDMTDADLSDTVTIYGVGGRFALSTNWVAGVEYLVQTKDNFGGDPTIDMNDSDLSLRLDYRF